MWIFNSSILDGFLSSLGCASKEKVGRLLRGRDCENHLVDNRFERFCYCRYHGCNHKSTYYSGADSHYNSAAWVVAVFVWGCLIMWRNKFKLCEGRTMHKLCAGPCSNFVKAGPTSNFVKDHVQICEGPSSNFVKERPCTNLVQNHSGRVQSLWRQDHVQTL